MDLDGRVREHPLDRLIRGDRLAELLAALAVRDGELEEVLTRAHGAGGQRDATDVERAKCRTEPRADLTTKDIRVGHLAIFEDELARVRAAEPHLVVDLSDTEPLEGLLDDEARDTSARAFCAIR